MQAKVSVHKASLNHFFFVIVGISANKGQNIFHEWLFSRRCLQFTIEIFVVLNIQSFLNRLSVPP